MSIFLLEPRLKQWDLGTSCSNIDDEEELLFGETRSLSLKMSLTQRSIVGIHFRRLGGVYHAE